MWGNRLYHAACRWPEIPCEYQLLQLAPSGALEEMFIAEFQEVNLWILMVSICFAEGFTNKNYEYMVSICGPASAGGSVCVLNVACRQPNVIWVGMNNLD